MVAFSSDKGEVIWKNLDDGASYSSGITVGRGKLKEYVFLTAKGVRGLAAKDGKDLWSFPIPEKKFKITENSTTPIVAGDLLLASTITYGTVGLKLLPDKDKTTVKQVWEDAKLTCYFSTPIPVGKKYVYMVTGALSRNPNSTLHCVEVATGKILWSKEKVGKYHAAMLKTGDNKLLMLSDLGELVLIDPDPKEYKELCRSKVGKGQQIWAHPALANSKVYFRDEKELICLQMPE